jgi:hypothetical protein
LLSRHWVAWTCPSTIWVQRYHLEINCKLLKTRHPFTLATRASAVLLSRGNVHRSPSHFQNTMEMQVMTTPFPFPCHGFWICDGSLGDLLHLIVQEEMESFVVLAIWPLVWPGLCASGCYLGFLKR